MQTEAGVSKREPVFEASSTVSPVTSWLGGTGVKLISLHPDTALQNICRVFLPVRICQVQTCTARLSSSSGLSNRCFTHLTEVMATSAVNPTDTLKNDDILNNKPDCLSTFWHLTLLSLVIRPLALFTKKSFWNLHFPRQLLLSFF